MSETLKAVVDTTVQTSAPLDEVFDKFSKLVLDVKKGAGVAQLAGDGLDAIIAAIKDVPQIGPDFSANSLAVNNSVALGSAKLVQSLLGV